MHPLRRYQIFSSLNVHDIVPDIVGTMSATIMSVVTVMLYLRIARAGWYRFDSVTRLHVAADA
jgi:hypothetical protein